MNCWLFGIIYIVSCSGFFIKYPFGPKFSIKDKDINKKITYNLPIEKQKVINKINGLYALIGPDVNIKNVSTIFDLFIGDGNIQGIFFDNGELTYVKHFVRTEKLLYEEDNGKIPEFMLTKLLLGILYKMHMFPNVLGLANTAILNVKNNIYALYERDKPYKLEVNFKLKDISTIRKIDIPSMTYFSAHSKYNTSNIESIDYSIFKQCVDYHELSHEFKSINHKGVKMNYLPIVHDFISSANNIIIIDSPLVIDYVNMFKKTMPVILDNNKKTIINVINKKTMSIEKYFINNGFYIFHYADYKETDKTIEIYASQYDKLDFSELNISGKYRKILINKETKEAVIVKDPELEKLDLEFPVKYGDNVVFRSMENRRTNGFVVCKDLTIIKKIGLENKIISGEPAITYINNIPYLITFAFDNEKSENGFLIIIDMKSYDIIEIPINETLNIGFHSGFIPNC
jgi:hypothetical protein